MPKPKIPEIADGHMLVMKAFRFRLKPTGAQDLFFRKTAGACRFVYNGALFQRQAYYRETGESLWMFGQAKHLTAVKRTEDLAWLNDAPAQCLQQAMLDVDTAYKNFFDDWKKFKAKEIKRDAVRFPRRHKKGKSTDSFRFPQGFAVERKRVKLPKVGWVKYFDSRPIQGKPKSITISRDGAHWYMSVLCELEVKQPARPTGEPVGIDLNVELGAAVALSNGENFETAKTSKREWRYLRKLHRIVSRRKKGSANHKKAVAKLAAFEKFRADRRKDAIHKSDHTVSQKPRLACDRRLES